jgi:hypothetical protein
MPTDEGAKTKDGLNGSDYHRSHTVEDVTKRNVQTIIKLEESAKTNRDRTDRMANIIAKFCGSFVFCMGSYDLVRSLGHSQSAPRHPAFRSLPLHVSHFGRVLGGSDLAGIGTSYSSRKVG